MWRQGNCALLPLPYRCLQNWFGFWKSGLLANDVLMGKWTTREDPKILCWVFLHLPFQINSWPFLTPDFAPKCWPPWAACIWFSCAVASVWIWLIKTLAGEERVGRERERSGYYSAISVETMGWQSLFLLKSISSIREAFQSYRYNFCSGNGPLSLFHQALVYGQSLGCFTNPWWFPLCCTHPCK